MRQCIGCMEMKPKNQLVRIVRSPEGEISVDATGKKNGRGAYLCHSKICFEKAVKAKKLQRTFEGNISDEVLKSLEKELESV